MSEESPAAAMQVRVEGYVVRFGGLACQVRRAWLLTCFVAGPCLLTYPPDMRFGDIPHLSSSLRKRTISSAQMLYMWGEWVARFAHECWT